MEFRCKLSNGSIFSFKAIGCKQAVDKAHDFGATEIEQKIYREDDTFMWRRIG